MGKNGLAMVVYSAVFGILLVLTIANYLSGLEAKHIYAKHASVQDENVLMHERQQLYLFSYLFLPLLILFLLSSFRYKVGRDYQHHIDVYHWVQQFGANRVYVERGYAYFNLLLLKLGLPAETIFVVGGLLVCGSLFAIAYFLIPSQYWSLFVLIFYFGGAFFSSLNIVRQYYAIALCLLASVFFFKKKFVIAIVLMIAGVLCHSAAVIFLMLPICALLIKFKTTRIALFILYCFSWIFIFFDIHQLILPLQGILPARWQHYMASSQFLDRDKMALLKLVVPNLTLIFYLLVECHNQLIGNIAEKNEINNEKNLLVSSSDIIMSGLVLFVISQNMFYGVMTLTRLSEFFWVYYYAAIIYIISWCKQRFVSIGFIVVYLLYFVSLTFVTIFIKNGNGVMPYIFIFAQNSLFV